jgi:K+-sensing histidine kinase KdpD
VSGSEPLHSSSVSSLLTNAAKYTPPEGKISVRATEVDGEIVLRVRDSGAGIAPQICRGCLTFSSLIHSSRRWL